MLNTAPQQRSVLHELGKFLLIPHVEKASVIGNFPV